MQSNGLGNHEPNTTRKGDIIQSIYYIQIPVMLGGEGGLRGAPSSV